jgi:hypothetical protein
VLVPPVATRVQAPVEASVASVAPSKTWPAGAAVHVNESVLVASTGAVEDDVMLPKVISPAENEEQVSGTCANTTIGVLGLLVDAACAIELPASNAVTASGAIFASLNM